ncbi:hypothetical protein L208DRAFT_1400120, partial [Tricholoma matsutake]
MPRISDNKAQNNVFVGLSWFDAAIKTQDDGKPIPHGIAGRLMERPLYVMESGRC